jgi:nitrate reductase cytochrome c-type subunit
MQQIEEQLEEQSQQLNQEFQNQLQEQPRELTHIVKDSLIEKNLNTCTMAVVSPESSSCGFTLSTLLFAGDLRGLKHQMEEQLEEQSQQLNQELQIQVQEQPRELTHIVKDSLIRKNFNACTMAIISPESSSCGFTLSTLLFANDERGLKQQTEEQLEQRQQLNQELQIQVQEQPRELTHIVENSLIRKSFNTCTMAVIRPECSSCGCILSTRLFVGGEREPKLQMEEQLAEQSQQLNQELQKRLQEQPRDQYQLAMRAQRGRLTRVSGRKGKVRIKLILETQKNLTDSNKLRRLTNYFLFPKIICGILDLYRDVLS